MKWTVLESQSGTVSGSEFAPAIACEKCHTADAMRPVSAAAYPSAVVVLGYVLAIPSALYITALLAGAALGGVYGHWDAMFAGVTAAMVLPALVPLALGMFFARRRKLWRCRICAYVYERG